MQDKFYSVHFFSMFAHRARHRAPLRVSLESPLLESKLEIAVDRINPTIPAQARQEAVRQVMRLSSPDLISANEAFHTLEAKEDIPIYQQVRARIKPPVLIAPSIGR